jgi:hypothetical protein
MSLSVVSSQDAILDHYGKLLVARLREAAPHIELEVCFPASADALISRFNEVLRPCSIEDAMGNLTSQAPPRIWIVHDAAALPDHEIQLLARLVQNFPGANIRVVMLLAESSQKHQLLNAIKHLVQQMAGERTRNRAGGPAHLPANYGDRDPTAQVRRRSGIERQRA